MPRHAFGHAVLAHNAFDLDEHHGDPHEVPWMPPRLTSNGCRE